LNRKKTGWDQMPVIGTPPPPVVKPQIVGIPALLPLSNQARQQRRLYVGNIPANIGEVLNSFILFDLIDLI
jgi:hypothetical protein